MCMCTPMFMPMSICIHLMSLMCIYIYYKYIHFYVDCVCIYVYVYAYVHLYRLCLYVTIQFCMCLFLGRKNAPFSSFHLLDVDVSNISNDVCVPSLYMFTVILWEDNVFVPLSKNWRYWVDHVYELDQNLTSFIIPKYVEDLTSPCLDTPISTS